MKRAGIVQLGRIELGNVADAGAALRQAVEGVLGQDEAVEPAIGRREDALAQLLLHDRTFALEHLAVDHRAGHAFGMGPQHGFQILRRDGLVIVGAIVPGRGVADPADILGQAVDHVVGHVLGLAAENVLEQVGKARTALRVVLRSDPVPDRGRDVGGGRVGQGDHGQPVGQDPALVSDRRSDHDALRCTFRGLGAFGKRRGGKGRGGDDGKQGGTQDHVGSPSLSLT